MATYTVTKVTTRPNTSTQWPGEVHGLSGYNNLSSKVNISSSISADELTVTTQFVWDSKSDYLTSKRGGASEDSTLKAQQDLWNTYLSQNNFEARTTEQDGTVRVFNRSNRTFEEQ